MSELSGLATVAAFPPGGYFSLVKILVVIGLLLPWLYAATWAHKDTLRVRAHQAIWCSALLGAGAVGVLCWLLVSVYLLGMLIYLALVGGTIAAYVTHRNKKVIPGARVLTAEHIHSVLTHRKAETVEVVQHLKLYDSLGRPVLPPGEEQSAQRQAYNLAQDFLHHLVMFRASQADVVAAGAKAVVRYIVDGVLHKRPPFERGDAEKVIDFIKEKAGMNVEDRRRPQEGKIAVEVGAVPLDIVVSSAGTTQGQRMLLKVVQEVARTSLGELGMSEDVLERLEKLNQAPGGLIIVAGPNGAGVTSTMYSLLRCHDAFTKQLAALEERPSVDLENVTQVSYEGQADLPQRLASLLRRDPDVAMVDRCETAQTAKMIAEVAVKKNMLLGMNADSVLRALAKWIKLAGDARREAIVPLRAVTCQTLLRKLCPDCREAYAPARDLLAKLNLPAGRIEKFYRPPTKPLTDEKGHLIVCGICRGTGYYGRTAVFEMLELNDEIRELVLTDAPLNRIKAACRKNKMLYLQEQALRKVIEGVTGVEEVIRVSKKKQQ